jgi:CopG family transcriptional regulator/antitoxin EndoAI
MKEGPMGRTTKTVTISIPPEMDAQIEALMREEGRSRSELLREALRRYVRDREWRELLRYGQRKAGEAAIAQEEIEDIIDAYRR